MKDQYKPSPPSPDQIKALQQAIASANQHGSSAASFSAHRLRSCATIGQTLAEWQRAIPRGEWESFATTHFPELTEETRRRWMRLGKLHAEGKIDLDNARSLRHAYQLAGILPDADGVKDKQPQAPESYLVHLSRLMRSLELIELHKLTQAERNGIVQRLAPILQFIQKLK